MPMTTSRPNPTIRRLDVASPVLADVDIANSIEPLPIAAELGLRPEHFDLYGKYKARVKMWFFCAPVGSWRAAGVAGRMLRGGRRRHGDTARGGQVDDHCRAVPGAGAFLDLKKGQMVTCLSHANPEPHGFKGLLDRVEQLKKELENAYVVDQFTNPENRDAHFRWTGPEIWKDTTSKVDIFVAASSSAGTVTSVGR